MARSKREIALVKRLARCLAAALPAELVWNWPERWSEWKEIGRVTFAGNEAGIGFDKEYLDDDHQMKLIMQLPARVTSIAGAGAYMTIGFNEEPDDEELDDAPASTNCHFAFSGAEERKKNSAGFEAVLYGRKRAE